MKVKYIGPHRGVDGVFAVVDGATYPARYGQTIEVPDDVGRRLVESPEQWSAAKRPPSKPTTKPRKRAARAKPAAVAPAVEDDTKGGE